MSDYYETPSLNDLPKHPWEARFILRTWMVADGDGNYLCRISGLTLTPAQEKAVAHLWAAAPDLYDAALQGLACLMAQQSAGQTMTASELNAIDALRRAVNRKHGGHDGR